MPGLFIHIVTRSNQIVMKGQWSIVWKPSLVTVSKKCHVCLHCEPSTGSAWVGYTRGLSTDVREICEYVTSLRATLLVSKTRRRSNVGSCTRLPHIGSPQLQPTTGRLLRDCFLDNQCELRGDGKHWIEWRQKTREMGIKSRGNG